MKPFYWKVGNDIYNNDIAAYIAATSTNTHPEFCITNVQPGPLWRKEPPENVHAYMDRVTRDIASKYDKIVLMYSGGTDSHSILQSFIRCGIRDVSIEMIMPEDQSKDSGRMTVHNWTKDTLKEEYNFLFSELGYTFSDYTDGPNPWRSLDKDELDERLHSFYGSFRTSIAPSYGGARSVFNQRLYTGKKTAFVWGYEKPHITIDDGWFCWTVSDSIADSLPDCPDEDYTNIFFYYSDTVPELQIKIAWLKMREIEKILHEFKLPITHGNVETIQMFDRKYSIYSRINRACGYQGINKNLDSALSKISPLKQESNHSMDKYTAENGTKDVVRDFVLTTKNLIDPKYLDSKINTPKGLWANPIRMREI